MFLMYFILSWVNRFIFKVHRNYSSIGNICDNFLDTITMLKEDTVDASIE